MSRDLIRVEVEPDVCSLFAQCVSIAPQVFLRVDDDVLVWEREVGPELYRQVEEAVEACPSGAIRIVS
jgi:ferredoxin